MKTTSDDVIKYMSVHAHQQKKDGDLIQIIDLGKENPQDLK